MLLRGFAYCPAIRPIRTWSIWFDNKRIEEGIMDYGVKILEQRGNKRIHIRQVNEHPIWESKKRKGWVRFSRRCSPTHIETAGWRVRVSYVRIRRDVRGYKRRSSQHSHQHEAKRPRCIERGRADGVDVRSWIKEGINLCGDPCSFLSKTMRPTSEGVTIGGSVESFERTLERENVGGRATRSMRKTHFERCCWSGYATSLKMN